MTISGGVSINGLLQGLPQGQLVIAQMTIPASTTVQAQSVLSLSSTTGVEVSSSSTVSGVLIIPPEGSNVPITLNTGANTTVVLTFQAGMPSVIALNPAVQNIYLALSTGTTTQLVQVIFF